MYKRITGLVACLSLLLLIVVSCGLNEDNKEKTNPKVETEMDTMITYLALGDSYTIGESVSSIERWPMQLALRLRADSIEIDDPRIIARTGWTTDELITGIEIAGISGTYDLVSLLIGVNNQYRGMDIENFRSELNELLDLSIAFSDNKIDNIFVLSIPDWGVMPFAADRDTDKIRSEIDSFNMIVKTESEGRGIRFFDITDISREASTNPDLIATDGLHPSGKMYSRWVDRIYSSVLKSTQEINR